MSRVHLDMAAVHFSTRCGAACSFCYFADPLADRAEPTPLNEVNRILTKLAADGVREVLFVGGDPVIHPHFLESLRIARQLGLSTSVLSNSWAVRPEEQLAEALELIDSCEATVLGATAATHDQLTQRPGSFERLLSNIARVSALGKSVGICTNATPVNLHEIYATVAGIVARGISVRSLMVQRIVPSGGASGEFKFGLNLNDVSNLMHQIDRVANEFGIPILFEDPVPWCVVEEKFHKYLARCEWGYTRGSVNSKGQLNRCGADDHYRLGSIWDGNVQDIWANHPILESFRSKQYLPAECQTCSLLQQCGGGCPLSCGTLKDHDVDQLYVQKVQLKAKGEYAPYAPDGRGFDRLVVRYAFAGDLESIVRLETQVFRSSGPLFTSTVIAQLFERCPKAFRVAVQNGQLLGYAAVFPLTRQGAAEVVDRELSSVMEMSVEGVAPRFGADTSALYLEVIAAAVDAPRVVRLALLKNVLKEVRQHRGTVFTCPISSAGAELADRFGFVRVATGSLYRVDLPEIPLAHVR